MRPDELLGEALAGGSPRQVTRALTVLMRMAADWPRATAIVRSALDDHLPDIVRRVEEAGTDDDRETLRLAVLSHNPAAGSVAALDGLPPLTERTAGVNSAVLLVAGVALEAAHPARAGSTVDDLAWVHDTLAVALVLIGEHQGAVAAARRATQLARELAAEPEHRHRLASALDHLRRALTNVSELDEAVAAGKAAVELWRKLGDDHCADLAAALTGLSMSLGEAGSPTAALAAAEEASALYSAVPETPAASLALILNNLSVDLSANGRAAEAVAASAEAVRLRRGLPQVDPRSYRDDLATALLNYAAHLGAVGQVEQALAAVTESVSMYRDLVEGDAERYLPDLAMSLHNLSVRLSRAGRPAPDVLAAAAEAVDIRRSIVEEEPDRHRPGLAGSLELMAIHLADSGDRAGALAAVEEAVEIRRVLATRQPGAHQAGLARTLRSLAVRLAAAGQPVPAVRAAEESVALSRAGAASSLRELAWSLEVLAGRLGEIEEYPPALAAIQESVTIYRDINSPARLAAAVRNLSQAQAWCGHHEQALATAAEAVTLARTLVGHQPSAHADLAAALGHHADLLVDHQDASAARAAADEALAIRLTLLAAEPDAPGSPSQLRRLLDALNSAAYPAGDPPVAEHYARLLNEFGDARWATSLILMNRAWWQARRADLTAMITDAHNAVMAQEANPDRAGLRRDARRLMRIAHAARPARFDTAWSDHFDEPTPTWLTDFAPQSTHATTLHEWLAITDIAEAKQFLADHDDLLYPGAEAMLTFLIDAQPGHADLWTRLRILREARTDGTADAYARHHAREQAAQARLAVTRWIQATSIAEMRQILDADPESLLSDSAATHAARKLDDGSPQTLWRVGLLDLARHDGVAAFDMLNSPDIARATESVDATRALALARIRAGLDPESAGAALTHASAALAIGATDEADRAMNQCTELSTSWERPEHARRLSDLARQHPSLETAITRLLAILSR